MKRFGALLLAMIFFITGCKVAVQQEPKKLNVVTTIFPLADLVSTIGGNFVKVDTLVPPGSSPHSYEPKPSDVAKLAQADMVLVVGAGLDDWVVKMAKSSGIDEEKIVDVSKFVTLQKGTGEESQSDDPHYWLSPKRLLEAVDDIQKTMSERDQKNSTKYSQGKEDLVLLLETIDHDLWTKIGVLKSKDIVTFHDAFGYLASDYGLKIMGVIELAPGTEPTPQHMQSIEDQIKNMGVKAVFAEPQLSSKVTESLKNDLGIAVGILDPLGGIEGRMTYSGLMKYNLLELERILNE